MKEKGSGISILSGLRKGPWRLRITVFLLTVIVIGYAWNRYQYSRSPEAVLARAIQALERKDAKHLCELADPEELEKTHLTPEKVRIFLNRTDFWGKSTPRVASAVLFDTREDKRAWLIAWKDAPLQHGTFGLTILDDPKIGWKLVLSDVLPSSSCWEHGLRDGWKLCYRLKEDLEIPGYRSQNGEYVFDSSRSSH